MRPQPRVLARTEIVQRFVVEGGSVEPVGPPEDDEQPDTLSVQEEENLRFWTAVLQDYSFADVTVDVPAPVKDRTLYLKVRNSGFGDWALCFDALLRRRTGTISCFLIVRSDQPRAVRVFDDIAANLEEYRKTGLGDDLEVWDNAQGRPRIGFRRQGSLSFLIEDEDSPGFRDAVAWMRQHLDRLVSGLDFRIQSMLVKER